MRKKFLERDRLAGVKMLQVRLSRDLYTRVEKAAGSEGYQHISQWVRAALIDAIQDAEARMED